jgi:hypothetical protein
VKEREKEDPQSLFQYIFGQMYLRFQISGRKTYHTQFVPGQNNPAALFTQTFHHLESKMYNGHMRKTNKDHR